MAQPFPTANEPEKGAIRLALENDKLVLFVGAGLSKGAGLPDWVELIQPLADELELPFPAPEFVNDRHLLKVADWYEHRMGRHVLLQYLLNRLGSPTKQTEVHKLLAAMPIPLIFTTNYDDLIEDALKQHGKGCVCVIDRSDLPYIEAHKTTVIKLCGDLNRRESVLITETDFLDFLSLKKPLANHLAGAFATHTTLFLGYSLQDPFFKYIWYNTGIEFGPHQRKGFAVMFNAAPHDIHDLQRRNITVINLEAPRGGETAALAEWLSDLVPPRPAAVAVPRDARAAGGDADSAVSLKELLGQVIDIVRRRAAEAAARKAAEAAAGKQVDGDGDEKPQYYELEKDIRADISAGPEGIFEVAMKTFRMGRDDNTRGRLAEARELCELSLKILRELGTNWGRCLALNELVLISQAEGELEQARWFANESLEIAKKHADRPDIAWATWQLGIISRLQGDYEGARELCEWSLRLRESERLDTAVVLHELCLIAQAQGDLAAASAFAVRSLEGGDGPAQQVRLAWVKNQQGRIARLERKLEDARLLCEQSLNLYEELNRPEEMATVLNDLSLIALDQDRLDESREFTEKSLRVCDERVADPLAVRPTKAWALNQRGKLARLGGDLAGAYAACEASLKSYEQLGQPIEITMVLNELGLIAQEQGRLNEAVDFTARSLEISDQRGHQPGIASAAFQLGGLEARRGNYDAAQQHLAKSLSFYQVLNESEHIVECVEQLEEIARKTGDYDGVAQLLRRALFFYRRPETPGAAIIEDSLERLSAARR